MGGVGPFDSQTSTHLQRGARTQAQSLEDSDIPGGTKGVIKVVLI